MAKLRWIYKLLCIIYFYSIFKLWIYVSHVNNGIYFKETGMFASLRNVSKGRLSGSDFSKSEAFIPYSVDESLLNSTLVELMKLKPPRYLNNLRAACFFTHKKTVVIQRKDNTTVNNIIKRLNCLPSVFIVGFSKCGTTEIHAHLTAHQSVIPGKYKEPRFWDDMRPQPTKQLSLQTYLNYYEDLTRIIKNCFLEYDHKVCKGNHTGRGIDIKKIYAMDEFRRAISEHQQKGKPIPFISIDASTTYINNAVYWELDPLNKGLLEANILTPHRIKHFIPQSKVIIMLRNPVERLLSDFYFFVEGKDERTPNYFHKLVVNGINWWKNCTSYLTENRCAFGFNYSNTEVSSLGEGVFDWGDRPGFGNNGGGRIRLGIYDIYIKKWLEVFRKENVLVICLEYYKHLRSNVLENLVLPFLNLEPYSKIAKKQLNILRAKGNLNINKNKQKMLSRTRKLLEDFYKPYNERLSSIMGDQLKLWNK